LSKLEKAVDAILLEKSKVQAEPCAFAPICKNTSRDVPGKWYKGKFICAPCKREIA
jgi:hypothetical protein